MSNNTEIKVLTKATVDGINNNNNLLDDTLYLKYEDNKLTSYCKGSDITVDGKTVEDFFKSKA